MAYQKKNRNLALILMMTLFLALAIIPNIASVGAQGQATIDVLPSVGGTTDPSGTTTYADGTVVTLTATAGNGFIFQYWDIVTSSGGTTDDNNPTTLTVSGGVTYAVQAIFQSVQNAIPGTNVTNYLTDAIVVVLSAVGGTTSPAAGTYALASAQSFKLTATPLSGWKFDHWVIGGSPLSHGAYSFTDTPTDNPYTVDHGYGNTYTYQAVFTPTTVPEFSAGSAGIITVALLLSLAVFGAYTFTKRKNK